MAPRVFGMLSLIGAVAAQASADQQLTARQILTLIQASERQVVSLSYDLTVHLQNLDPKPPFQAEAPFEVERVHVLWTPEKSRFDNKRLVPSGPKKGEFFYREVDAYSEQWHKQFREKTDGSRPRGLVLQPPGKRAQSRDLHVAWGSIPGLRERVLENPAAKVTERDGQYTIEATIKDSGARGRIVVDATKGYLIRRMELLRKDGTTSMSTQCSDFRKVGAGLWLPHQYTETVWPKGDIPVQVQWMVDRVEMNVPISAEALDVRFPEGTLVSDRIAGLRYVVDAVHGAQVGEFTDLSNPLRDIEHVEDSPRQSEEKPVLGTENLKRTEPLSEAALRGAAEQSGPQSEREDGEGSLTVWIMVCLAGGAVVTAVVLTWLVILKKRRCLPSAGEA